MRGPGGSNTDFRRGFALLEVLLALLLGTLLIVLGLSSWVAARESLFDLDARMQLQQSLRVAFDLLSRDARLAEFGADPDGALTRTDEGIEGAWPWALIVRADRDRETAEAEDPERELAETGRFHNVSTGNDEIVAWVLAGSDARDSLTFHADVVGARDGRSEPVLIDGVATTQDRPPYELVRVSLDPRGRVVRVPVIRSVRRMTFRYRDAAGNELAAPGGAEDPLARDLRSRIRRVEIEIVGETSGRNAGATFRLAGGVALRNAGRRVLLRR